MNFIKLTDANCVVVHHIWVNVDNISFFSEVITGSGVFTGIKGLDGNQYVKAKETPEEIEAMILGKKYENAKIITETNYYTTLEMTR